MSQNINNINNEATVGAVAQLAQLGAGAVGAVKGAYAQHKAQKKAKKEKEEDLKMKEETRQLNKFDVAYENVMSKLYVPLSEDEHKEKGFFAKAGDLAGKAAKLAALAGAGYGIYKLGGAAAKNPGGVVGALKDAGSGAAAATKDTAQGMATGARLGRSGLEKAIRQAEIDQINKANSMNPQVKKDIEDTVNKLGLK